MQRLFRIVTTPIAVFAFPAFLAAAPLTWIDGVNIYWFSATNSQNANSWRRADTTTGRWVEGSEAIFAGNGGTVSAFGTVTGGTTTGPTASALTFNSPGYTIAGTFGVAGSTLTVTTNSAATLSGTINLYGDPFAFPAVYPVLVKQGTESLTISGYFRSNRGYLDIRKGEVIFSASILGNVLRPTLADDPTAILTLAIPGDVMRLSTLGGSSSNGGIIRPNNAARTLTVNTSSYGNIAEFAGSLQDNGPGQLALELFGTPVFTGESTYSGTTRIFSDTPLLLKGRGRLSNTPSIDLNTRASLTLDNSAQAISGRLKAGIAMPLSGKFLLTGNGTTAVAESVGKLTTSMNSTVQVDQPGAALTRLSIAQLAFNEAGTVRFAGNGQVLWSGTSADAAAVENVRVTYGDEWATVANDGKIGPQTIFTTDLNAATGTSRIKVQNADQTLASSITAESLRVHSDNAPTTVALNAQILTLNSGGILSTGSSSASIAGGTLQTSASQWVMTTRSNLDIPAVIAESVPSTGLLKVGPGSLSLTGNNSFSGRVILSEGTLTIGSEASLGSNDTIIFAGGTLSTTASLTLTKKLNGQEFSSPVLIDTAGHDLNLVGLVTGALTKTGEGRLTVANLSDYTTTQKAGELALPNGSPGTVSFAAGTLIASGTLSSLSMSSSDTSSQRILDIGGPGAASLTTTSLSLFTKGTTTFRFSLGSDGTDQWVANGSMSTGLSLPLFFEFNALGDVSLGTDYPLVSNVSSSDTSLLALSPANVAAGWQGTFKFESSTVKVRFSSVPEPSVGCLGVLGLGITAGWRRRGARPRLPNSLRLLS